jgi:hypothetical protein
MRLGLLCPTIVHPRTTRTLSNVTKPSKKNFHSDSSEAYSSPFSKQELEDALHKAHDSAVGPDQVHYQLLKHLPEESPSTLLKFYNDIWATGDSAGLVGGYNNTNTIAGQGYHRPWQLPTNSSDMLSVQDFRSPR